MFALHTTQITNILFLLFHSHLVLSDLVTMFFPKFPRIHIECILGCIFIIIRTESIFQLFLPQLENIIIFIHKKVLFANGLNIVFKSKVALSHINMVFPKKSPGKSVCFGKNGNSARTIYHDQKK